MVEVNSERWLSLEDFEGEVWKKIEDSKKHGVYYVSNYGRVKRMPFYGGRYHFPEMIFRQHLSRDGGYYKVRVAGKMCPVHRLVALAFLPRIPGRDHVDHINSNAKDNRACNLRWASAKMNMNNPITKWNRTHKNVISEEDKPIPQMSKIDANYKPEICVSKNEFDGRLGKRSQKLLEETILGESVGCLFPPDF